MRWTAQVLLCTTLLLTWSRDATGNIEEQAELVKATCAEKFLEPTRMARHQVYEGMPFSAGERAQFEVSYMGIHAGFATLEVKSPIRHNGQWQRVFSAEAKTGDWYETIFTMQDLLLAYSQPWDFGISHFYIEQDEGKIFSSRWRQQKWIDFDHRGCLAHEKVKRPNKDAKQKNVPFLRGSIDALGAYYYLRTKTFTLGEKVTAPVYTSEKNWILEAEPVAFEEIEVPAGKFKTVKLKLQTYIGKYLQQKGDVHLWLATDHPGKMMVQVKAEIAVGSIWIKLKEFAAGKP